MEEWGCKWFSFPCLRTFVYLGNTNRLYWTILQNHILVTFWHDTIWNDLFKIVYPSFNLFIDVWDTFLKPGQFKPLLKESNILGTTIHVLDTMQWFLVLLAWFNKYNLWDLKYNICILPDLPYSIYTWLAVVDHALFILHKQLADLFYFFINVLSYSDHVFIIYPPPCGIFVYVDVFVVVVCW